MGEITLRDYQVDGVDGIRGAFRRNNQPVLFVLPTGGGKTYTFSYIADSAAKKMPKGGDVEHIIIVVHRKELLLQASASLRALGIDHGMISPHFTPASHKIIQVASIDTLLIRLKKRPMKCRLLIFDEAHHVVKNNKWGRCYDALGQPATLGVTATPVRGDRIGLGEGHGGIFKEMVLGPSIQELIDMEMLLNPLVYTSMDVPDTSNLKLNKEGDFNLQDLAERVDKPKITGSAVEQYTKVCPGAKCIVFCASIAHAEHVVAEFNRVGYRFAILVGEPHMKDSERTAVNLQLRNGELDGVCTVDLVSEGYDLPNLQCCIMLRPTASESLFIQQCLDDKTEILTNNGWKKRNEITNDSIVAGFNMTNDEIEWCNVDEFIERKIGADEEMFLIDGPHLNLRVTGGHDLIIKAKGKTAVNWHKFTAKEASLRKSFWSLPVCGFSRIKDCGLTDHDLHFIGWFLSDGSMNKKTNGIYIAQSASKPEHCEHIRKTLLGCGVKFRESRIKRKGKFAHCEDSVCFTISKGMPRGTDKDKKGWEYLSKWLNKDIPPVFDTLSAKDLKVMLCSLNLGDGSNQYLPKDYTKHTMCITTGDNIVMADRIQQLCVMRGLRCNQSVQKSSRGHKDQYFLYINDKKTASMPGVGISDGSIAGKKAYTRTRLKNDIPQDGEIVWCVRNRLGSLVIRREGKVAIVGNCGRVMRPADGKEFCYLLDHVGNVGVLLDGEFKRKHGLPNEIRSWTLEGGERKKGKKKPKEQTIDICQCPKCYLAHVPEPTCPRCGHIYEAKGRSLEQVEGELYLLTEEMAKTQAKERRMEVGQAKSLEELKKIAAERGYSPGWAKHIWAARSKKKAAPARLVRPPAPSDEELAKMDLDQLTKVQNEQGWPLGWASQYFLDGLNGA